VELFQSAAHVHAHMLRAEVYLEAGDYEPARDDMQWALDNCQDTSTVVAVLCPTAWRILADAHVGLGQYEDAIQALQQWAEASPSFATKAAKEIQRVRQLQQQ